MTAEELQELADRLAPLLNAARDLPVMVTADELAEYLRTSPDRVRANPARWGAIRIGEGPKSHLRFPLDRDKLNEWAVRPEAETAPGPPLRRPSKRRPDSTAPLIDYEPEK